jgi:hypothetical protein
VLSFVFLVNTLALLESIFMVYIILFVGLVAFCLMYKRTVYASVCVLYASI